MPTEIQPIIVAAPRQRREVDRLVQYCRQLDGTEVLVIPADENGEPYPHRNNSAFHKAAARKEPFIWLEPDSIPLKPGWAKVLTDEFIKSGAEMMISADINPPHDMVGGIGVYGPNTHWLVPKRIQKGGFDGWIVERIPQLVHRTPLIQHSYQNYAENRKHSFPRDNAILRDNAVIFHADTKQTLIPSTIQPVKTGLTFIHSGDIGDIVAALPTVRELGSGRFVITKSHHSQRESMQGRRFDYLAPLLAAQPYIEGVEWSDEPCPGVDFREFRFPRWNGKDLASWQAGHVGVEPSLEPWLTVEPDKSASGRIIVNRTPRYHNPHFPWKKIIRRNGDRLLFVGLPEEHQAFQRECGRIQYRPVRDALELAGLIAGAGRFIGNQSSAWWIAAGLGVEAIQETDIHNLNSILPGKNLQYSRSSQEIQRLRF